ncbi:MAG: hypothetical protein NPIRA03_19810 [Nitrospirales bacterium]|nr:MAG: hypothetical protein NPIRA03_19810 [Nitrospirales bacterium]
MPLLTRIVVSVLVLWLASGCASTKVTERHRNMTTEKLAKPERIYVYPFAATLADIPSWSTAAEKYAEPSKPPTPEEYEIGRKLGVLVAKELVTEINDMGVLALEGSEHSLPKPNDLMIIGYFEGVEEGSTIKRLGLGFGSGAAELRTAVEGYQMTPTGPRLLGSGKLDSGGGKLPGLIVPIAVLAATANPIGLIVMGTAKVEGEMTGRTKIEGTAKRTAEAISEQLRVRFKEEGLIK